MNIGSTDIPNIILDPNVEPSNVLNDVVSANINLDHIQEPSRDSIITPSIYSSSVTHICIRYSPGLKKKQVMVLIVV